MSFRRTFATARRVLAQLRHDPRTIALLLVVPCLLVALLKYIFDGQPAVFDRIAPLLLGIFPLLMMFLVTSIVTLRERRTGTLDRLLTMPMSKLDFMVGYGLAFALLALIQACVVSLLTLGLLGVTVAGGTMPLLLSAVLAALLGTTMGLLVSAFASSEFQAVELVMPILMPQILLCGLFVPRAAMARWLQLISDVLPLTYSVDAMRELSVQAGWTGTLTRDLSVVVGCAVLALLLGSITIRRQA